MSAGAAEASRFVSWLREQVIQDARGDNISTLDSKASDRFWLGRLAPEEAAASGSSDRSQRMDPCSSGFRFRPGSAKGWVWSANVSLFVWTGSGKGKDKKWIKSPSVDVQIPISLEKPQIGTTSFGSDIFKEAFDVRSLGGYAGRIDVEVTAERNGLSAAVVVVNASTRGKGFDPNFYEVNLRLDVGEVYPFVLDALPDSFRYNRSVDAYGINGGVRYEDGVLETTDAIVAERFRPEYWDRSIGPLPDIRFETLARDPLPSLEELVDRLRDWGEREWSWDRLSDRSSQDGWTAEMSQQAQREADKFQEEIARIERGLDVFQNPEVLKAFLMTNEAFMHSGRGRYESWRPFQLGFLLACLPGLIEEDEEERLVVDTLWFATGGGKTETYLAVLVMAALYDRIRGKGHGVTGWSRFPLRMLSLQQTQRFADAFAGAELSRRRAGLRGDPLSIGFLVGRGGTPNKVRDEPEQGEADANDPSMPERYRVLLKCPFCHDTDLVMAFSRRYWRLEHRCANSDCPWPEQALPFYVVDEEIFRFLPTAVQGTLDKAASVSIQAAMRGLYASPLGKCSMEGHGFTYAPRSKTKGCLVPGCSGDLQDLPQGERLFPPSVHVQDELHLLRGGLGALDAHYETLLDHLARENGGIPAKIIASSATLAGYEEQVLALYAREGKAFPLPGPTSSESFWTRDGPEVARHFVGLAPRGVTQEFANERIAETLQRSVRRLLTEPERVCSESGCDSSSVEFLLSNYGTNVVYGTKIRDVEAAARSFESQPGVTPLIVRKLTGSTPLEEVRGTLDRLTTPETDFDARIHTICASSMMSHGVDIDRLNVITMLGMPLATAEFIQTTARIGRRLPGLVFTLMRMGIERDASAFRFFDVFIRHAERFIEPVAITRKSRRVLEHTFAGLFAARVLGVHEPARVSRGDKQLTTASELARYFQSHPVEEQDELEKLRDALCLNDAADDDPMVRELRRLTRETFREIYDPATKARWVNDLPPDPPIFSLREVESQVPIHVIGTRSRDRR